MFHVKHFNSDRRQKIIPIASVYSNSTAGDILSFKKIIFPEPTLKNRDSNSVKVFDKKTEKCFT